MYFVHVYIKKIKNKNFKISKSFPKKEKIFQIKKKSLWTRGIEPFKKKKKNFKWHWTS